jgi:MFS family permease
LLKPGKFKNKLFYGWVIVVAFCIIGTIIAGAGYSFGVFFKSIESEFELSRTVTSGIFSVSMIFVAIFAVLGGWAADRYGPRITLPIMGLFIGLSLLLTSQTNSTWQLFFTYSLLLSIGTGATFVVMTSTVSRWFVKKKGVALGIAGSGVGLGALFMAPFATFLIVNFDWRTAYIIMGLLAWVIIIPLSRLLKKDPHEIRVLPYGVNATLINTNNTSDDTQPISFSLRQALKTRSVWLFMCIWFFDGFTVLLILTHIVPHITDIGFSAGEAATVLSLRGGAMIMGRVIMGRISDSIGRKTTVIFCSLLQAGAILSLVWINDLWMFYIFAIVFGFSMGGAVTSVAALVSDIYGLRNIGKIFGILEIGLGIGAAIGPAMGGLIFDIKGSYSLAFLLGAGAILIVSLLVALVGREREGPTKISGQEV